eukprot:gene1528-1923_t
MITSTNISPSPTSPNLQSTTINDDDDDESISPEPSTTTTAITEQHPLETGIDSSSTTTLSTTNTNTQSTASSTTITTTNNDILSNKRSLEAQEDLEQSMAKKQKNFTTTPSKVVHLRNLPLDATEHEVMNIAIPFGNVEHLIVLKGKGQALVQMSDLNSAAQFIQYYSTIQGMVRSKQLYVQYSNRDEILQNEESSNEILLITITNIIYPITIDVLFKLFSNYGNVLKILIFTKSGNFQSLIQMKSTESAIAAKRGLDGQNIYNGCCTLKIQYSSLTSLKIKYNNDKSRDFTNPSLLPGNSLVSNPMGFISPLQPVTMSIHHHNQISTTPLGIPTPTPLGTPGVVHHHHQMMSGVGTGVLGQLQPPQNSMMIGHHNQQQQPPQQQQMIHQQQQQQQFPVVNQQQMQIQPSQPLQLLQQQPPTIIQQPLQQQQPNGNGINTGLTGNFVYGGSHSNGITTTGAGGNSVLIVAGLPTQGVTPDDLFTLFGVYGDPIRVKIMFNRKDTALIQMNLPQQAGHTIRVNISKHTSISLPKSGDNHANLTKDYTGSLMHRFKLPGSKNYQNIHPPSHILHLSNLPISSDTEEVVKKAFSINGEIKSFKFFQNDNKMALVEMASLEDAINSLVALHGYMIGEHLIKLSFAKPTIKKNL